MTARHLSFLLLCLLAVRSHQRPAQGEQGCTLAANRGEGESKGVLVPTNQCTTFREQPQYNELHSTHTEHVCCPVFQSEPNCGRISQYAGAFSFDSREAKLDQFPWAAVILRRRAEQIVCSGSLITSRFVLSAAHCFEGTHSVNKTAAAYRVRLGDWDLLQDEDCLYVRGERVCNEQQPLDYTIEKIISHAAFQQHEKDLLHDIALLQLTETVTYGALIGPACLPTWNLDVPAIVGQNFTATGWGHTRSWDAVKRKYKVEMKGRNISACIAAYRLRAPDVPRIHLCVGGAPRRDVCHGDSGGGLMRRESDRWIVEGIISFGAKRCGSRLPGVYTNVARYIDWIQWAIDQA